MEILIFIGFALFGLLIGTLFGFFGMGGTFLITPALIILSYPTPVAVGTGMAFVFGTAIIAALKHRDLGQVDYKLAGTMILGTALGIHLGKEIVLYLDSLGLASGIISYAYVILLTSVGLFIVRDALRTRAMSKSKPASLSLFIQGIKLPPMLNLRSGGQISIWIALAIGLSTGLLSGFLGVGGGFIRMPVLMYVIGLPAPLAVGTDLFEIVFSGGIGSFLYAQSGAVDLLVVSALLVGSALGAQFGAMATRIVDEGSIKIYFGAMVLGGAVAVALRQIGQIFEIPGLDIVSFVLIVTAALLVTAAVLSKTLGALRELKQPERIETT